MASLDNKLTALATMSPAQLRAEWARLEKAAPPRLSTELLRCAVGYRLQERVYGGLSAADKRELSRLNRSPGAAAFPRLKPGTRLLRSWNGRTICVLVTETGYVFDDRTYGSLSGIAREVTGAAWSGPRFFGLRAVSERKQPNG